MMENKNCTMYIDGQELGNIEKLETKQLTVDKTRDNIHELSKRMSESFTVSIIKNEASRRLIELVNIQIEIDRLKTIMDRTRKPRIKKKLLKRILSL